MVETMSRHRYIFVLKNNCLFHCHGNQVTRKLSSAGTISITRADFNIDSGVKTITMDDPKSRNSLSISMMESLIKQLNKDRNDDRLRSIILTAEGPVFSAGHNFKELGDPPLQRKVFDLASTLMCEIINCPVPIIAKLDGLAAAAGCQLIGQCDLAYATANSRFSTPGVNFGLFCSTPGVTLVRKVPRNIAMKMLLTGLPIGAEEAERVGLINKSCLNREELDEEVKQVCEEISKKSRKIVEFGKKFYYKQIDMKIAEAYQLGGEAMVENLHLKDGKEGVKSFLEKRKPLWK